MDRNPISEEQTLKISTYTFPRGGGSRGRDWVIRENSDDSRNTDYQWGSRWRDNDIFQIECFR